MNKSKWFSLLLLTPFIVACGNVDGTSSSEGIDLSKFPLYTEDVNSIEYNFNDEAVSNPFWKGNVIYNETVLLTLDMVDWMQVMKNCFFAIALHEDYIQLWY